MTISDPLFEKDNPRFYSDIAGPLVAKYVPLTQVAQELYRRMLAILDSHNVEYFLFAGSLVGYVRDSLMPPWLDDIDVILFEEQIENFEKNAVPDLERAGFVTFRPNKFPQGGYHILGLRETTQRDAHACFGKGHRIKIPRAQLDVFYTEVSDNGTLKNLGHWGLYNRKKVPAEWVRPGTMIEVMGRKVRAFSEYEKDILHEYGDVHNNIVVYSHGRRFLELEDVTWGDFSRDFYRNEGAIKNEPLNLGIQRSIGEYVATDEIAEPPPDLSFLQIVSEVVQANSGEVRLTGEKQWFWTADLKKVCPGLRVVLIVRDALYLGRAAHMLLFADEAQCSTVELMYALENAYTTLTTSVSTDKVVQVETA